MKKKKFPTLNRRRLKIKAPIKYFDILLIAADRARHRRYESFDKSYMESKRCGVSIDPDLRYLNWGRKGRPSWGVRKRLGENINFIRENRLKQLLTLLDNTEI